MFECHERVTEKVTRKVTEKVTEKVIEKVIENQQRIIDEFFKNKHITAEELSRIIGIPTRKIKENIQKLKVKGLIDRVGTNKGGYWIIKDRDL